MTVDPLLRWRAEFPITDRSCYLISNSLGPMPRTARDSLATFADMWDHRGVRAWAEGWWVEQDRVADLVADLLGTPANSVSMHQNVAMASEVILSCFNFRGPRNRIVLTELDFPSVMYLYQAQQAHGAEIVRVPADSTGIGIDLQRLLDAIDERTLLVPMNHVLFRSAMIQDVRAVVEKARKVGAFVILDVFQSVGTLPLRLAEWGVHAAVGGALKFLCGGPGNGFLYVDPAMRQHLTPTFTGWAAHREPFAFSTAGQDYRADGGRFATGTPNVPALFAGREGIRIVREVGIEAIRRKSQRQTALLVEGADRHGLAIKSPRDSALRGGHVSIDVPAGYEVCQVLLAEDIVVDYRPGAGLRVAPHFFTTDDECQRVVARIADIVERREYQRFVGGQRAPG